MVVDINCLQYETLFTPEMIRGIESTNKVVNDVKGGLRNKGEVIRGSPMFAEQSSPIINPWKRPMDRTWPHVI